MDKTLATTLIAGSLILGATGSYIVNEGGQVIELTDRQRYIEIETIKGNVPTFDLSKLSAEEVSAIGVDAGVVATYLGADLQGATEECAIHNIEAKCNLYNVIQDKVIELETNFNKQ